MKVIEKTRKILDPVQTIQLFILVVALSYTFSYFLKNLYYFTPFIFGSIFGISFLGVWSYIIYNLRGEEENDSDLSLVKEEKELIPIRELEEYDSKELSKCTEENLDQLINAIDDEVLKVD